jgi:hypothetical protein
MSVCSRRSYLAATRQHKSCTIPIAFVNIAHNALSSHVGLQYSVPLYSSKIAAIPSSVCSALCWMLYEVQPNPSYLSRTDGSSKDGRFQVLAKRSLPDSLSAICLRPVLSTTATGGMEYFRNFHGRKIPTDDDEGNSRTFDFLRRPAQSTFLNLDDPTAEISSTWVADN